jgi:flagellar biosynthetic protein FlhB
MASGDADDKERTEQPSARRREEARRKGQLAKSADLSSALLLLGALGAHAVGGGHFLADSLEVFQQGLRVAPGPDLTPDAIFSLFFRTVWTGLRLVWPFLLVPAAVAVAGHLLQTRFVFSTEALQPQWKRIDPLSGFGRLWSARSVVELGKSLAKLAAVGSVAFLTLRTDWGLLLTLGQTGGGAAVAAVGQVVWDLWLRAGLAYFAIGALDYAYQWWQQEKSLRMTRGEAREESKQSDGDPLLKSRIRSLHRQMATKRMMSEVKKATVVLRNPTHLAVALRYDNGQMFAPKVVAKGERLMALRIIETAREAGVPVVENPPLARAINAAVKVGRQIPPELYRAVAEVLAYVYSLVGRRA